MNFPLGHLSEFVSASCLEIWGSSPYLGLARCRRDLPRLGLKIMVGWSGRLGTVTGCSVRVRAPKVWKTLSAKEGGYVNMWLHTCNNTVSTFYTHCWAPGSWGISESAFICLHSLIWLSVCLLAASRQHVHSYCNSSGTFLTCWATSHFLSFRRFHCCTNRPEQLDVGELWRWTGIQDQDQDQDRGPSPVVLKPMKAIQ